MRLSSHSYPRPGRSGVAAPTASVNDLLLTAGTAAFFLESSAKKLTSHSFPGTNENVCHTFSPLGGTWDYSEVD
ncbi:MAG: hypothetical protein ABIQ40_19965 [Bacteroidia bacterium]